MIKTASMLFVVSSVASSVSGCGVFSSSPSEGAKPISSTVPDEGGPDASGDERRGDAAEAGGACPGAGEMVRLRTPGGGSYCIDRHLVTQAEYQKFVDAHPVPASKSPYCEKNTSYAVVLDDEKGPCTGPEDYDPVNTPLHPASCIDWCDAFDYCLSIGKELCGAVGGGPTPWDELNDPNRDAWYNACSAGGKHTYNASDSVQATACRMSSSDGGPAGNRFDVGTNAGCVSRDGDYGAVADLLTGMAEFENAAMVYNGLVNVSIRGNGPGGTWVGSPSCDAPGSPFPLTNGGRSWGFRCCSP